MTLPIETERATLRRLDEGDVSALLWLSIDPGIAADASELGSSPEMAERYIERQQALEPFEPGAVFDLAIELRGLPPGARRVVGLLTLVRHGTVGELGYALHSEARGSGIVTEAAAALVDYGFRELGLTEMLVETAATNLPARRVAERLGMRLEPPSDDVTEDAEPGVTYRIDAAGLAASSR